MKPIEKCIANGEVVEIPFVPNESGGILILRGLHRKLAAQISNGLGWDHISVSVPGTKDTPSWYEMEYVRKLFSLEDERWVQFGLGPSEHINIHPGVLHWWRKQDGAYELPPKVCV